MNNIPDRALLKNLGHWLGIITIAKNKPILATVCQIIENIQKKNNVFVFYRIWILSH